MCSKFRMIEQDEQIEVRWMLKCVSLETIFPADLEKSYPSPLGCIFLKYDYFSFKKVHLISTYENNIRSCKEAR